MVLQSARRRERRRWSEDDCLALLAEVPLFARLPAPTVERIASLFRPRRLCRGEFVFLEGEPSRTLNLLAEGRIKIIRETDQGRQVILRVIGPGELFGVSGSWDAAAYPASARALDEVVVLQLPTRAFTELVAAHHDLAVAVITEMGRRLREAEARILDLQTERVEQRLARAILRLLEGTGRRPGGGMTVALSRQDLADLSGTTLSTTSRTLRAWHRQGLIVAGREHVGVLDPDALGLIAAPANPDGPPRLGG